ncbi:hypothetical protein AAG570_000781 [Ranatra chinensis]|uniref:Uncharacterized protein n=1 Tax=Ranatra chinensis TaxID=642074 RepID=A0ABD0YY18_9HEMI
MVASEVVLVVVLASWGMPTLQGSQLEAESHGVFWCPDAASKADCFRKRLLDALDQLATGDEDIRLNRYIQLVKIDANATESSKVSGFGHILHHQRWCMKLRFTLQLSELNGPDGRVAETGSGYDGPRNEADDGSKARTFVDAVEEKLKAVLRTHSIRIHLSPQGDVDAEARRLRYKKAFPLMVAGFVMMSSFLVPLGFQFMAMLGGKALLLSKIALLFSLYQGYNRNTGGYPQTPNPHLYRPWRRINSQKNIN